MQSRESTPKTALQGFCLLMSKAGLVEYSKVPLRYQFSLRMECQNLLMGTAPAAKVKAN